MDASLLQQNFNLMIRTDTRPLQERDRHQKKNGIKRTNIDSVRVLTAPSRPAGATPLPTKQILQTYVANAGNTQQGILVPGPMDPSAINQKVLSDCYLLVAIMLIIFKQPNFFDDLIVPIGNGQVVVQFYSAGVIVQITTSLLISTNYDDPANGDIRPELLEKCYGLYRSGVSDYLKDNFGLVGNVFAAFGLDASYPTSFSAASIAQQLSAGQLVALETVPVPLSPWIDDHFYGVRAADSLGNLILRNPWYGASDMPPAPPTIIANRQIFVATNVGTFPASKRILASYVPGAVLAIQGKIMTTISATQPTVIPVSAATLFDDKLETQGGRQDIGYLASDGWMEEALTAAAAGTFALTIPVAAIAAGSLIVSINGAVAATVPFVATGGWGTFVNSVVQVQLPAGASTLRIAPAPGAQYNLADLSIAPATKQMKSVAIDFTARTATAVYSDNTTAILS